MGFFSELFNPKSADPSKPDEAANNAALETQRNGVPSPAQEPLKCNSVFRPVSAETRKKTSRLSASRPEREVKLVLGDVLHRIPSNFLKPGPHDLQRPLHFNIQDLFSDIARGRATVPLSKIAKLCPEVFREQIDLVQDIEVQLPLQKLVGQVSALPVAKAEPEKKPVPSPAAPEKSQIAEPPRKAPAFTDENISLRLAAILRTVPKEAIIGEMEAIDYSVRITLPYRFIEPQLSSGKVELLPNDFIDALPTEYRIHFARGAKVKIPIPLEEILAAQSGDHVPKTKSEPASLTAEVKTENPRTEIEKPEPVAPSKPEHPSEPMAAPFARRLTIPPPLVLSQLHASNPSQPDVASESAARFASLQAIFQTNETLDAQKVAELICGFSGIAACVIVSKKNLIKAGEIPSDFNVETFCRTSSELSQSFASCAKNLKIGPTQSLVLECQRLTASFFSQPEACLCVFQKDRNLPQELREKLTHIIAELARVL